MTITPSPRRRLLGSALRQYRDQLGLTMHEAAQILECDVSKLSRIETGQRGIRAKELRELLGEYGISGEAQEVLVAMAGAHRTSGWWQDYVDVLSADLLDFSLTEGNASRVLVYGPHLIPDLLQTLDYAVALAVGERQGVALRTGAAVEARQAATWQARKVSIQVLLGEEALERLVGDRQLMRGQLEYLVKAGEDFGSVVSIQVLARRAGAPALRGVGSLSILEFSSLSQLRMVHLDGPIGGVCLAEADSTQAYVQAFLQTQTSALGPDASMEMIRQRVEA